MPPAKSKTKKSQIDSLVHPAYALENLRSPGGVDAASNRLTRISQSVDHLKSEFRDLLSAPDVLSLLLAGDFHYILSCMNIRQLISCIYIVNNDIRLRVESLINHEFPRDSKSYSSSFLVGLLIALNSFFSRLAPPECVDSSCHQEHGASVPRRHHALQVIDTLDFEQEGDQALPLRSAKLSQRRTKQIQRRAPHPQTSQVDPVFDLLKVAVPCSPEESKQLCSDLLLLQSASLSVSSFDQYIYAIGIID